MHRNVSKTVALIAQHKTPTQFGQVIITHENKTTALSDGEHGELKAATRPIHLPSGFFLAFVRIKHVSNARRNTLSFAEKMKSQRKGNVARMENR